MASKSGKRRGGKHIPPPMKKLKGTSNEAVEVEQAAVQQSDQPEEPEHPQQPESRPRQLRPRLAIRGRTARGFAEDLESSARYSVSDEEFAPADGSEASAVSDIAEEDEWEEESHRRSKVGKQKKSKFKDNRALQHHELGQLPRAEWKYNSNCTMVDKFKEILSRAGINLQSFASQTHHVQRTIADLLQSPVQQEHMDLRWKLRNRDFTRDGVTWPEGSVALEKAKGYWYLTLLRGSEEVRKIQGKYSPGSAMDITSPARLAQISATILDLIKRWPYGVPSGILLTRMIVAAAVQHHASRRATPVHACFWDANRSCWILDLHIINTDNGKGECVRVTKKKGISVSKPPSIPSHIQFSSGQGDSLATFKGSGWKSFLPPREAKLLDAEAKKGKGPTSAQMRQTEHFLRWCAWRLSDVFSTPQEIMDMVKHLEDEYTYGRRSTRAGAALSGESQGILTITKESNQPRITFFQTPRSYRKQLGIEKLHYLFKLRTSNKAWQANVMETARTVFVQRFDPFAALMAAAEQIDQNHEMIRMGEPKPDGRCACTDQTRENTLHVCQGCLLDASCNTLDVNENGVRVCQNCIDEDPPDDDMPMTEIAKRSVKSNTTLEFKSRKMMEEHGDMLSDLVEANTSAVLSKLDGLAAGEYKDAYTGKICVDPAWYSGYRFSTEAVLPFAPYQDQYLSHVPENLETIPNWSNLLHKTTHVGVLEEVAKWCRNNKSDVATRTLLDRVQDMVVLRLALPHQRRSFPTKMTLVQYALLHHEWKIGRLLHPDRLTDRQVQSLKFLGDKERTILKQGNQFTRKEQNTIRKIVTDIATKFNKTGMLVMSRDRCPWPRQLGSEAPSWWDWGHFYTFCRQRYIRLVTTCNRHWITVDTELSLGLEFFYQLFSDEPMYQSMLGLPLCILQPRHPFNISFGHSSHGRQLRSAWLENASSLQMRDHKLSNLRIMTFFENSAEWNWPEHEWPRIARDIAAFRIPKVYYDPDEELPIDMDTEIEVPRCNDYLSTYFVYDEDGPLEDDDESTEARYITDAPRTPQFIHQRLYPDARRWDQTVDNIGPYGANAPADATESEDNPPTDVTVSEENLPADVTRSQDNDPEDVETQTAILASLQQPVTHESPASIEAGLASTSTAVTPGVIPAVGASAWDVAFNQLERSYKHPIAHERIRNVQYPPFRETLDLDPRVIGTSSGGETRGWMADDLLYTLTKLLELDAPSHVEIFEPTIFTGLIQRSPTATMAKASMPGWQGKAQTLLEVGIPEDIVNDRITKETTKVVALFNIEGVHWVTVALEVDLISRTGTVRAYDSMFSGTKTAWNLIGKLISNIKDSKGQDSAWKDISWEQSIDVECPQQKNHADCGLFALYALQCQVTGESPNHDIEGLELRWRALVMLRDHATGSSSSQTIETVEQPEQTVDFWGDDSQAERLSEVESNVDNNQAASSMLEPQNERLSELDTNVDNNQAVSPMFEPQSVPRGSEQGLISLHGQDNDDDHQGDDYHQASMHDSTATVQRNRLLCAVEVRSDDNAEVDRDENDMDVDDAEPTSPTATTRTPANFTSSPPIQQAAHPVSALQPATQRLSPPPVDVKSELIDRIQQLLSKIGQALVGLGQSKMSVAAKVEKVKKLTSAQVEIADHFSAIQDKVVKKTSDYGYEYEYELPGSIGTIDCKKIDLARFDAFIDGV